MTNLQSQFLLLSTVERLKFCQDPDKVSQLKSFLGPDVVANLIHLAKQNRQPAHLAHRPEKNMIFIPGVMGSSLQSKTLGSLFWLDLRNLARLNGLQLREDGLTDLDPALEVSPVGLTMEYEGFLAASLRHETLCHETFPYDWRKPWSVSAERLKELVDRLWTKNGREPIHLVCHSMGGLVARSMLVKYKNELEDKIGRIVFIGTPHYGTPAIAGYLKNHLWGMEELVLLATKLSRETFRSLWGVLGLLPAPVGIYPGTSPSGTHPCAGFDFYQAKAWHLGIDHDANTRLQIILDAVANQYRLLEDGHKSLGWNWWDRMLIIAGVGIKTLFCLRFSSGIDALWGNTVKDFQANSKDPDDPHRVGDGRVPLASAKLPWVASIRYIVGEHTAMMNTPSVQKAVFQWLEEGKVHHLASDLRGAYYPKITSLDLRSEVPALDGSDRLKNGDPGYWIDKEPSIDWMAGIEKKVVEGTFPELGQTRLL